MTRYYVEHDGRVRIERSEDRIDLPETVDVPVEETARRTLRGTEVVFAQAKLDEHPEDWPRKDDLAHDPDATPLVHAAINASLFRPVVGVIVENEGEILLVKPSRGVATGRWTLPGGFLNFFEQPHEGARREVREEVGLEVEDLELATTVAYQHHGAPYPILGLGFTARASTRKLTLREEEIGDATWMDPVDAMGDAGGIARAVLEAFGEGADELA